MTKKGRWFTKEKKYIIKKEKISFLEEIENLKKEKKLEDDLSIVDENMEDKKNYRMGKRQLYW